VKVSISNPFEIGEDGAGRHAKIMPRAIEEIAARPLQDS
jgi:hypothetical protein